MKILGALFGFIFGILFAGGGIMIAMETAVPTYQSWQAMQHWQPTSATLLKLSGSDNDTEASYRYHVDDIEYQNDRVYVAEFKDNIGSYHQDLYQKLRWIKDNYQPLPIWYNPSNPADSVIDREMRWGLFALMSGFCSIFIIIGLAVCYGSLKTSSAKHSGPKKPSLSEFRRRWRQKQTEEQYDESFLDFARQQAEQYHLTKELSDTFDSVRSKTSTPWLDKKEWRNNRIRSGARSKLIVLWVFGLVWSAVTSPTIFVLEEELRQQNYAALFGLLFPLVGVIVLFVAWRMTQKWLHFGVIELELDPFPGSIGGHVGGRLMIRNTRDYRTPYRVDLACLYSYVSGTGDSRTRHESVKWSEQGYAKTEATGRGVRLEFRFAVPDDLPEADVDQRGQYYYWRLRLSAEVDGVELERNYNIPVFKTQSHSRYIRHDNSAQAEALRKEKADMLQAAINRGDFDQTALVRSLRYKNDGQKQVFYFPMFRNKLLTVVSLLFAGGFDFAAYQINQAFGDGEVMSIAMLVFSLPFALVGLIATVAAIYLPLNNLRVTLANRQITALRRLLFIPIFYHSLPDREIRRIEIKSTGSTGATGDTQAIKHYKLVVVGKNQQRFTIAEDIDGEDLAEQLKRFIAKRLGIAS